jgi:porphobilinogen deaminase
MAARNAIGVLDEPACRRAVQTERAALYLADGGCTLPFGAWCTTAENGMLSLTTALGREDGTIARSVATGTDPQSVAAAAWSELARGVSA